MCVVGEEGVAGVYLRSVARLELVLHPPQPIQPVAAAEDPPVEPMAAPSDAWLARIALLDHDL